MIALIVLLSIIIVSLGWYLYHQNKIINALKSIPTTTITIGKVDPFTADDELRLSSHKEALQLLIKKIDTNIAITANSLRVPSEDLPQHQGKFNYMMILKSELIALYNKKFEN